MIFAALSELVMTHIFHRKKLDDVGAENLSKITANVQKRLKPVSFGADLLKGGNIDHTEKKAQNSDAEQGEVYV